MKTISEKDNTSKLLKGCGIGCGALVLIFILAVVAIYTYVSHKVKDVEEIDRLSEEIEGTYGTVAEFTPAFEGAIIPERIEIFIQIRDSLLSQSPALIERIKELELTIAEGKEAEEDFSFSQMFDVIKNGIGILPEFVDYYYNRNFRLREMRMGLGEYYYLYVTSYYCFLHKNPSDGPAFKFTEDYNSKIDIKEGEQEPEIQHGDKVFEDRDIDIRGKVNKMFIGFFENLLSKADNISSDNMKIIKEELERLKNDKYSLPWKEGLPDFIEKELEPYRFKLERTYSVLLNPLAFKNKNDFR